MQETTIQTPADLETLAAQVLAVLPQKDTATVLALHGDLGAGKTAFSQALARRLGVIESVTSPTFVVMRLYPIPDHSHFSQLIHVDAYRVESLRELEVLGLKELLANPHNLICIEWAERVSGLLPEDTYHLAFAYGEGSVRTVAHGIRYG